MLLLKEVSFCVINNLGTPSSELQINFGELQTDTENSATGQTSNFSKGGTHFIGPLHSMHEQIIYILSKCRGTPIQFLTWTEESGHNSRVAQVVMDFIVKHIYPNVSSINSNFAYVTLVIIIFIRHEITKITQVWVHHFKSFSRVKSSQDGKAYLIEGIELKLSEVE